MYVLLFVYCDPLLIAPALLTPAGWRAAAVIAPTSTASTPATSSTSLDCDVDGTFLADALAKVNHRRAICGLMG